MRIAQLQERPNLEVLAKARVIEGVWSKAEAFAGIDCRLTRHKDVHETVVDVESAELIGEKSKSVRRHHEGRSVARLATTQLEIDVVTMLHVDAS